MLQIGAIVITSSGQFQLLQIGTKLLQIGAELLQIELGQLLKISAEQKVYFKYNVKCNKCQMCLLMDFGY